VPRTEAVRDAESDLEIRTLVVVPVNASVRLYSLRIKREAIRQLGLLVFTVEVSRLLAGTYLLRFDTRGRRNAAHRRGTIMVGQVQLCFMPWQQQVSATTLSRF
jgi:hypothetical protein